MTYRIPALLRDLRAAFPSADTALIHDILAHVVGPEIVPATAEWVRRCYHRPRWAERAHHAADVLLGGHGVERIEAGRGTRSPAITYSNQGDTYTVTLLRSGGRWMIGDWGSRVERGHYD